MTLTESVSAKIRAELRRQDVSFRELGRRMGVSLAYISRRLSDDPDVEFKVSEIERVAEALGVPVTAFLPRNAGRRKATPDGSPERAA